MEILTTFLIIAGILLIFCGFMGIIGGEGEGFFAILLGFILLYITPDINAIKSNEYKVRELEKNTVFTITDKSNKYLVNDTIWVNTKTKQIDPQDSVAMMCVIISK